jgi:hypothetical protein
MFENQFVKVIWDSVCQMPLVCCAGKRFTASRASKRVSSQMAQQRARAQAMPGFAVLSVLQSAKHSAGKSVYLLHRYLHYGICGSERCAYSFQSVLAEVYKPLLSINILLLARVFSYNLRLIDSFSIISSQ